MFCCVEYISSIICLIVNVLFVVLRMQNKGSAGLVPYDPEFEKNKKIKIQKGLEKLEMEMENFQDDNLENRHTSLRDIVNSTSDENHSSIQNPVVEADSFEINPEIILLVQNNQFGGTHLEDPYLHLSNFLELCATFRYNGMSDNAVRLRLFPFSLRDKAKMWLYSLAPSSIKNWEELTHKFLAKYFPPSRTTKLRNDIISFCQYEGESIYEAWERFKELLRKCPHHALPDWLIIQTFYNGLVESLRSLIDAAAGGSLMSKSFDEAYALIEEMATNEFQWPFARVNHKRVASVHDSDVIAILVSQVAAISKKIDQFGKNHPDFNWNHTTDGGNQQWENNLENPNGSWNNLGNTNNRPSYPPDSNNDQQFEDKKMSMEEVVLQMGNQLQSQNAVIKNIDNQLGEIANSLSNRPQGTLPSNAEIKLKENDNEQLFLVTGQTMIDVQKEELIMNVNEQEVTFDMLKTMNYTAKRKDDDCIWMDEINYLSKDHFQESFESKLTDEIEIDFHDELKTLFREDCMYVPERCEMMDATKNSKLLIPCVEKSSELKMDVPHTTLKPTYLRNSSTQPVFISLDATQSQEKPELNDEQDKIIELRLGREFEDKFQKNFELRKEDKYIDRPMEEILMELEKPISSTKIDPPSFNNYQGKELEDNWKQKSNIEKFDPESELSKDNLIQNLRDIEVSYKDPFLINFKDDINMQIQKINRRILDLERNMRNNDINPSENEELNEKLKFEDFIGISGSGNNWAIDRGLLNWNFDPGGIICRARDVKTKRFMGGNP